LQESLKEIVALRDQGKEAKEGNRVEELKRLFDMETSVERFLADYV
jgi:hypothetical protein